MSEEVQNQTIESAPTPETQAVNTDSPGVVDVNSKVEVGGKEVPIADLMSAYGKVNDLENYKRAASAVMKGDQVPEQDRESAMRYLMQSEGYTPAQIDEYISEAKQMYDQPVDNNMEQPQETPQSQPTVDEDARRQLDAMQKQNSQMMVDMLKTDLSNSMERTMSSNPQIQTLINKSKQLNGEDDISSRISSIRDEVQRMAVENMRQRRSRGEKFDKSWFDQETNKAADTVYQRIRSVIGDPDKIQRAPETASSVESFMAKPAVPAPNFEMGDRVGDVHSKAHDFTVDQLSRLAGDLAQGGETRI